MLNSIQCVVGTVLSEPLRIKRSRGALPPELPKLSEFRCLQARPLTVLRLCDIRL